MKKYILAIDQGTTSTRAVLVDFKSMEQLYTHQIELPQHFPAPSQVEHNLEDIWNHTCQCIEGVIKKAAISAKEIVGIGITNQRETTCAFNKKGIPLARAIVWQDKRTASYCEEHKNAYGNYKNKTGLPLDPYFSATKMRWLLKHNDDVKRAAKNNDLCFGTIDTYLLYRLTNGQSFKTDATNASRTMLLNLDSGKWDKDLISFFEIDKLFLPEVVDTFSNFGTTKNLNFLPDGIPILSLIGDQQSALLGQHCTTKGMSKCTYGTGAFFLLNTGGSPIYSKHGLLTTIAYKHQSKIFYALEGASFIAGAGVQWLRDQLKIIKAASDIEIEANKIQSFEQVKNLFFFPFFSGIGSPYWRSEALASIYGMSRDTGIPEICYALLDGLAQSITDLVFAAQQDLKTQIDSFHVDGGACKNNLLMQLQANYLQIPIKRPSQVETTVSGAALGVKIALEALDPIALSSELALDSHFAPKRDDSFLKRRDQWNKLVSKFYL